ncbi:hypothetical protein CERSUDRAFT_113416 [Gelatoporia subvermispora B]|uniref:Uncharacterized protein n=1 Tax=Ceriporiopsis subvermispora (strain B) TaxID=914234 RepID=M2QMI1_CERS8|nr:hypothetical protein CERSUDRAFT_113416 [Gelatoporia subvermispora B]
MSRAFAALPARQASADASRLPAYRAGHLARFHPYPRPPPRWSPDRVLLDDEDDATSIGSSDDWERSGVALLVWFHDIRSTTLAFTLMRLCSYRTPMSYKRRVSLSSIWSPYCTFCYVGIRALTMRRRSYERELKYKVTQSAQLTKTGTMTKSRRTPSRSCRSGDLLWKRYGGLLIPVRWSRISCYTFLQGVLLQDNEVFLVIATSLLRDLRASPKVPLSYEILTPLFRYNVAGFDEHRKLSDCCHAKDCRFAATPTG